MNTKRVAYLIIIVALTLGVGATLLANQLYQPIKRSVQDNTTQTDLCFAILGDVHGNTQNLQVAIHDLSEINPSLDALVLNGDTVDQGTEKQYQTLKKTLLKNRLILPDTIIKNIGNHEFFDYEIKENSTEDVQRFIQRYLDFAVAEKVYHDTWIKGYHFISLGSEDGNSQSLDSVRSLISDEQQKWLQEKLAEKHEKGKPIFVFHHQPLNSNPNAGWVGSDQSEKVKAILSSYQEVVLFTSHTHADLSNSSIKLNQPYTTVHTGAIHYTIMRRSQAEGGVTRESLVKGLYVEVIGNTVVIKGRDFKGKEWIFNQIITK